MVLHPLDRALTGVPAHLSARLCASFQKHEKEPIPFGIPAGFVKGRAPDRFFLAAAASPGGKSCPRLPAPEQSGLIVEIFGGQHRRVKTDFGLKVRPVGPRRPEGGTPRSGGQGSESPLSHRHAARDGLIATGGLPQRPSPPNRRELVDRAEKAELVATLREVFKAANVVVVAHYSGLTVAQMQTLRRQMRQAR